MPSIPSPIGITTPEIQADIDAAQAAANAYTDSVVTGLLDDRGNYDASGNVYPSTGGSGTAGAIKKGDVWYISVQGTLGGTVHLVGSSIRALVDAPGQTAANWASVGTNLGYVPEDAANKQNNLTASATKYPTVDAVIAGLATKLNAGDFSAAITAQVGVANSSDVKAALNASGTAPIYATRAWANIDQYQNSNVSGTYSRTGTTVTVTLTSHGYLAGDYVYVDATSGTMADILTTVVSVVDANTFTITHGTSGSTSGNCNVVRQLINGSGNISSVTDGSTGFSQFNFTVAMPNTNYSVVAQGSLASNATVMMTVNEITDYARTTGQVTLLSTFCSHTVPVTWGDNSKFSMMVVG